ncbi:MAG: alpha/beta hydrolase [Bacteroidota bacterium]
MATNQHQPLAPPSPLSIIGEGRTMLDISAMAVASARNLITRSAPNNGRSVIMLPGFYSDDRYMKPLGAYLKKLGYHAEGWGLGLNLAGVNLGGTIDQLKETWDVEPLKNESGEASVPYLCDRATERIRDRSDELESPVTLIGWSLGGYIAREVARDLPDRVEQVITMGAPIIGGPKYTSAAPFFKKRGMNLDYIESEIERRERRPIQQPITAIFSKSDAIVTWQAAMDYHSPNVEHIEVNAAHLGMGFNQKIWKIIKKSLASFETVVA